MKVFVGTLYFWIVGEALKANLLFGNFNPCYCRSFIFPITHHLPIILCSVYQFLICFTFTYFIFSVFMCFYCIYNLLSASLYQNINLGLGRVMSDCPTFLPTFSQLLLVNQHSTFNQHSDQQLSAFNVSYSSKFVVVFPMVLI